uniref:Uncharacterized protein n=1 Tax=Arundo donax TaxID=35708 RepID=A0A0A9HHU7_ARUDO
MLTYTKQQRRIMLWGKTSRKMKNNDRVHVTKQTLEVHFCLGKALKNNTFQI